MSNGNGKGSSRRPGRAGAYAEGWERIFGAKTTHMNAMCGHRGYPSWVCSDCCAAVGAKLLRDWATWHEGVCGVCQGVKDVTEPRDYGYPRFK